MFLDHLHPPDDAVTSYDLHMQFMYEDLEDNEQTPPDGIDRCHWLLCYEPANGAAHVLCALHDEDPNADAVKKVLLMAAEIRGLHRTLDREKKEDKK